MDDYYEAEATGTAFDLDGDGYAETTGYDADADGLIETYTYDADADGALDAAGTDADLDGVLETVITDSDGDGVFDTGSVDDNQDGILDRSAPLSSETGSASTGSGSTGTGLSDDVVNNLSPEAFDTYMDILNGQAAATSSHLQPEGVSVGYDSSTNANEYTSADGDQFDTQSGAVDDNRLGGKRGP